MVRKHDGLRAAGTGRRAVHAAAAAVAAAAAPSRVLRVERENFTLARLGDDVTDPGVAQLKQRAVHQWSGHGELELVPAI